MGDLGIYGSPGSQVNIKHFLERNCERFTQEQFSTLFPKVAHSGKKTIYYLNSQNIFFPPCRSSLACSTTLGNTIFCGNMNEISNVLLGYYGLLPKTFVNLYNKVWHKRCWDGTTDRSESRVRAGWGRERLGRCVWCQIFWGVNRWRTPTWPSRLWCLAWPTPSLQLFYQPPGRPGLVPSLLAVRWRWEKRQKLTKKVTADSDELKYTVRLHRERQTSKSGKESSEASHRAHQWMADQSQRKYTLLQLSYLVLGGKFNLLDSLLFILTHQ